MKSRIKHALNFQKPAVWVSLLAVLVLAAVLVVFGTNGKEKQDTPRSVIDILYESRNPYVGDVSANVQVLGAVCVALPEFADLGSYKTALQTTTEPYGLHFILEDEAGKVRLTEKQEAELSLRMVPAATLMLSLIDNLGEVRWIYYNEAGDTLTAHWNVEQASAWYGFDNVKDCANSPSDLQMLLDAVTQQAAPSNEQALGERRTAASWEEMLKGETRTVLAQSPDGIATLYGAEADADGARCIIIDYRITPDGDSNESYFKLVWYENAAGYEIYLEGDQLILQYPVSVDGVAYELKKEVFDAYETGHLESVYGMEEL